MKHHPLDLFMKSQVRRRMTKEWSGCFHMDVKRYVCTFVFSLSFIVFVFCLSRKIHPSRFSLVFVCYSRSLRIIIYISLRKDEYGFINH